jgi:PRTRC genetic system ThiF family protein
MSNLPSLDYLDARPVVHRQCRETEFLLVGTGGTGSWLAPHLARLVRVLNDAGKPASVKFIDPDIVTPANVPRQHFCDAEIGLPKASVLALRYGTAWGLDIPAIIEPFTPEKVSYSWDTLTIIIGCVDNAAARQAIAQALQRNEKDAPRVWWLDTGNGKEHGQVLLGTANTPDALQGAFRISTLCTALPSPALQHPELLEPLPEELQNSPLSCAQLAQANAQSLPINPRVAAEAFDYLLRLTFTGDLRRFATYIDLPSGTTQSRYTTPTTVGQVIGQPPAFFDPDQAPGPRGRPRR